MIGYLAAAAIWGWRFRRSLDAYGLAGETWRDDAPLVVPVGLAWPVTAPAWALLVAWARVTNWWTDRQWRRRGMP